eukprot:408096_1
MSALIFSIALFDLISNIYAVSSTSTQPSRLLLSDEQPITNQQIVDQFYQRSPASGFTVPLQHTTVHHQMRLRSSYRLENQKESLKSLDKVAFKDCYTIILNDNPNIFSDLPTIQFPKLLSTLKLSNTNLNWTQFIHLNLQISTPFLMNLNIENNPQLNKVRDISDEINDLNLKLESLKSLSIDLEFMISLITKYSDSLNCLFPELNEITLFGENQISEKQLFKGKSTDQIEQLLQRNINAIFGNKSMITLDFLWS